MDIQKLLKKLDGEAQTAYPSCPIPQKVLAPDGTIQKVVTCTNQIRLKEKPQSDWEIWAPVLYQSCMEPERIEVRCLTAEVSQDGTLRLAANYGSRHVRPEQAEAEVSFWEPVIQKMDCRHCRNCGRCSW